MVSTKNVSSSPRQRCHGCARGLLPGGRIQGIFCYCFGKNIRILHDLHKICIYKDVCILYTSFLSIFCTCIIYHIISYTLLCTTSIAHSPIPSTTFAQVEDFMSRDQPWSLAVDIAGAQYGGGCSSASGQTWATQEQIGHISSWSWMVNRSTPKFLMDWVWFNHALCLKKSGLLDQSWCWFDSWRAPPKKIVEDLDGFPGFLKGFVDFSGK